MSHAGKLKGIDEANKFTQNKIDYRLFKSAYEQTPLILKQYFRDWAHYVPSPMIGAVLALLNLASRDLVADYLKPYRVDLLLDYLDAAGGDSIEDQLDRLQLAVHVIDSTSVMVLSLLGDPIEVPLDQNAQTLLAGPVSQKRTCRVQVPLRKIDPSLFTADQLATLLRSTAETLCAEIYPPKRSLERVWEWLDSSDQLDIETARRKILYHIPFYLRQLSIRHHAISEAILDYDNAFTADTEAGDTGDARARRDLNKSLDALARLIGADPIAQQSVLAGVKAKLNQFEYDTASIPFEIFQNADDAAVELGQTEAHPFDGCEIPAGSRRLVVEADQHGFRFLHWGRPINARGPVGFDGERRGYGRDLEKMLILSVSDKQANQAVTGKYGLGFKSVLLACDRPRILSGRLAVEVVAGLLPEPWTDTEAARDCLTRHAEGSLQPGTLIELPVVSPDSQILERFKRLAGLLCVFGQSIRTIAIHQAPVKAKRRTTKVLQAGIDPQRFNWEPKAVCPGVECGRLDLTGDWGAETPALCVRTDSGAILIALGPNGFRPLPVEIPSIWVTAPTQEKARLGFAINGRFDLNVGRIQLTGKDKNQQIARQIGSEAGDALADLFERSRDDWNGMRQSFGLAADVSLHDFWHGVWIGLTKGCLKRLQAEVAGVAIGREVVVALFKRLTDCPQAIPNGLVDPFQSLISVQDARYELADILNQPKVIDVLAGWDRFTAKYPASKLVSPDIGAILRVCS